MSHQRHDSALRERGMRCANLGPRTTRPRGAGRHCRRRGQRARERGSCPGSAVKRRNTQCLAPEAAPRPPPSPQVEPEGPPTWDRNPTHGSVLSELNRSPSPSREAQLGPRHRRAHTKLHLGHPARERCIPHRSDPLPCLSWRQAVGMAALRVFSALHGLTPSRLSS